MQMIETNEAAHSLETLIERHRNANAILNEYCGDDDDQIDCFIEAEISVFDELVSYKAKTLDEARTKARYLLEHTDYAESIKSEYLEHFLQSFV